MLCIACGAEMRLLQAVEDTTMFVSGYEHQTWQCSGCSSVERRMTFNREGQQTAKPLTGPRSGAASLEPEEQAQEEREKPAPIVAIEATHTAKAESGQAVQVTTIPPAEATNGPEPPNTNSAEVSGAAATGFLPKTIDERIRYLSKRAAALREAAAQDKRRAQFNRDWSNMSALRSPLGSSSRKDHKASVSPAAPGTGRSPAPNKEPTAPERAATWSWRRLLRLGWQKSS